MIIINLRSTSFSTNTSDVKKGHLPDITTFFYKKNQTKYYAIVTQYLALCKHRNSSDNNFYCDAIRTTRLPTILVYTMATCVCGVSLKIFVFLAWFCKRLQVCSTVMQTSRKITKATTSGHYQAKEIFNFAENCFRSASDRIPATKFNKKKNSIGIFLK